MRGARSLARRLPALVVCVAAAGCGVGTTATSTSAPTNTSTPAAASASSGLPVLDAHVTAHVLAIYRHGLAAGNRPDVFAKVGDSNTATQSFLRDIGCGRARFGAHLQLAPTVRYYERRVLPAGYVPLFSAVAVAVPCPNNSFVRIGFSAHAGWSVASVLGPPSRGYDLTYYRGHYLPGARNLPGARILHLEGTPAGACPGHLHQALRCELHVVKPSLAFVMIGTNDLGVTPPAPYGSRLQQVITEMTSAGTIPILSTIPSRQGAPFTADVAALNRVIVQIATRNDVPLWDFGRALAAPTMVDRGLGSDQIHLSVYDHDPGDLEPTALRYGANLRNLQALQILARFRALLHGQDG